MLELPWTPGGENAIQSMLDDVGLPWRMRTEDIIARFGLSHHAGFDWEQSLIVPCPLGLDGLIYPLSPEPGAFSHRDQVPLSFSGEIWINDDPIANIEHAHRQLAKLLGPAPIIKSANTYAAEWRAGPASVSVMVWPAWLQHWSTENPAHDRDNRLKTACLVRVKPGYRRPLNEEERAWLKSVSPFADVAGFGTAKTLHDLWSIAPVSLAQDYLRLPPTDQDNFLGQIGFSTDDRAMIISTRQLYIVPVALITGLTLTKMLPAKGSGGAGLALSYRSHGVSTEYHREIGLAFSGEKDALDDLAFQLSKRIGCALTIPDPEYDC